MGLGSVTGDCMALRAATSLCSVLLVSFSRWYVSQPTDSPIEETVVTASERMSVATMGIWYDQNESTEPISGGNCPPTSTDRWRPMDFILFVVVKGIVFFQDLQGWSTTVRSRSGRGGIGPFEPHSFITYHPNRLIKPRLRGWTSEGASWARFLGTIAVLRSWSCGTSTYRTNGRSPSHPTRSSSPLFWHEIVSNCSSLHGGIHAAHACLQDQIVHLNEMLRTSVRRESGCRDRPTLSNTRYQQPFYPFAHRHPHPPVVYALWACASPHRVWESVQQPPTRGVRRLVRLARCRVIHRIVISTRDVRFEAAQLYPRASIVTI